MVTIRKAMDASPELRSKKQLIESFIANVSGSEMGDVMEEWHAFVEKTCEEEFETLIAEEKLRPAETRKFMENTFRDGEVKTTGTDIDRILPPMFLFGGGRAKKKQGVIEKLKAFFEKFSGVVGNAKFTAE